VPVVENASELAELLGLDPEELAGLTRGVPYVEFEIDKATGGKRRITAPKAALKRAQRAIHQQILSKLAVHRAAHGFVSGRSIVTNAEPHQRAAVVVKMDLIDFFPTVHYRRVLGVFQTLGYSYEVAQVLAGLCTHRPILPDGRFVWPGVLPQGAPTSPAITNLICARLDRRLSKLAEKSGATYTRYADDLTFSFAREPQMKLGKLCWWVDQICQQEGFVENAKKRRVLRRGSQQRITGIVVNDGLRIPREERRRFRAILHNVRKNGLAAEARGRTDFAAYLRGFAAYARMVQPELGEAYAREVEELLRG
jgi:retron-type reverse transcriptase